MQCLCLVSGCCQVYCILFFSNTVCIHHIQLIQCTERKQGLTSFIQFSLPTPAHTCPQFLPAHPTLALKSPLANKKSPNGTEVITFCKSSKKLTKGWIHTNNCYKYNSLQLISCTIHTKFHMSIELTTGQYSPPDPTLLLFLLTLQHVI